MNLDERIDACLDSYFAARHIKEDDQRSLATGVLDMAKAHEAVKHLLCDVLEYVKPLYRANGVGTTEAEAFRNTGFNEAIDEMKAKQQKLGL